MMRFPAFYPHFFTSPKSPTSKWSHVHNALALFKNFAEDLVEKAASPTTSYLNVEDITDNPRCEQDIGENIEDTTVKVVSSSPPEESIEITTIEESESNCSRSAQTDDSSFKVSDARQPIQNPDIVPEQQNKEHQKTSMNNRKRTRASKIDPKKHHSSAAQTEDSSFKDPDASLPVQNSDIVPEQQNEELRKASMNNQKKTRASKIDPKKRRNSLAGGGSSWTTGVRRSSRIKTKPLEYWKGERLLYARVHNSLPTVIGVKYISPIDSKGIPGFKVESFVADEYKDLIDLISLH